MFTFWSPIEQKKSLTVCCPLTIQELILSRSVRPGSFSAGTAAASRAFGGATMMTIAQTAVTRRTVVSGLESVTVAVEQNDACLHLPFRCWMQVTNRCCNRGHTLINICTLRVFKLAYLNFRLTEMAVYATYTGLYSNCNFLMNDIRLGISSLSFLLWASLKSPFQLLVHRRQHRNCWFWIKVTWSLELV